MGDATVTFSPGPALKAAVYEAIDAGIKCIVSPVERTPIHDVIVMLSYALKKQCKTARSRKLGVISPGKAAIGVLGGSTDWAQTLFEPGSVGVIFRSGAQSGTVLWVLKVAGLGIITVLHIITEPILGLSMAEVIAIFEEDRQKKVVAIFGEIGGSMEEEVAELLAAKKFTKPLVVFIAGAWAPEGMRISHASSIVERGKGSAKSKIEALAASGAYVVDSPEEIAPVIKKLTNL